MEPTSRLSTNNEIQQQRSHVTLAIGTHGRARNNRNYGKLKVII